MSVLNIDNLISNSTRKHAKNHSLVPQHDDTVGSYRWLISGKSGTGKSNLVVSTLMQQQIKFDHLYIYLADPTQDKYILLQQYCNSLQQYILQTTGQVVSIYTIGTSVQDVVPLDKIDKTKINVAIFDDLLTEKNQAIIADYFIKGRHSNISCIYLTQSYVDVPRIIRKNLDYISLFSVSSKTELTDLSKAQSLEMSFEEFKDALQKATDRPNFLFIDRRTVEPLLRIRKNFDEIWNSENKNFEKI
jgi:hypothetical protein